LSDNKNNMPIGVNEPLGIIDLLNKRQPLSYTEIVDLIYKLDPDAMLALRRFAKDSMMDIDQLIQRLKTKSDDETGRNETK